MNDKAVLGLYNMAVAIGILLIALVDRSVVGMPGYNSTIAHVAIIALGLLVVGVDIVYLPLPRHKPEGG